MCSLLLAAALFSGASALTGSVVSGQASAAGEDVLSSASADGAALESDIGASAAPYAVNSDGVRRTPLSCGEFFADEIKRESAADDGGEETDRIEKGGASGSDAGESADAISGRGRRSFDNVSADGSRFGVMYDGSGTLLFDVASFARFAGASDASHAGGELRATGGGYDVTVREDEMYILSSGRAFWMGMAPTVTDEGVFVPAAPAAAAFGFTMWDDSDGGVTLSGGGPIESAESFYDADELYWLSHIIYAESGCEPMLGKIAVGNVVLNRVRSELYPDTIYGVIFDRRFGTVQFTPVASGTIDLEPSEEAVIAAKICLEGFSLSDEIEFFFNPDIAESTWISDNRPWIMTIAHHEFYG